MPKVQPKDEPKGGQFEVLEGTHVENAVGDDRVVYTKGEIVTSPHDLDRMFANKFRRVGGPTKKHRDRDDSLDNSGRVMDDTLEEQVTRRENANEPETDLAKLRKPRGFHAKAKDGSRVRGEDEETGQQAQASDADEAEEEEEEATEPEPEFGDEVTDQFTKAQDAGLTVFKDKKKGFTVVDPDRPTVPLNKEPLKDKKDVTAFFKEKAKKKSK